MRNNLRTRLHFVIGLVGALVFCFGIFILASAVKIRNIFGESDLEGYWDHFPLTCHYWAGIPTILTGGVLMLTGFFEKHQHLKYISLCCVLITMVLTLGVIIEETYQASTVHVLAHDPDSYCKDHPDKKYHPTGRVEFCNRIEQANPWYYILLFTTDIVLVLCCFGMLLLFADWILFVAPELSNRNEVLSAINGHDQAHSDECGTLLCPPQVQNQALSVAGRPSPCYADECRARSSPPQAQEQVWLPLETR